MMADRERETALRRMLRMVWGKDRPGVTDGELLRRFVDQHDEAAFETLLWRHGPMVFRLCRRLLGRLPDAEDAFQAVFLVLCRKAGSISNRQSVGSWLYKVAYRICLRARSGPGRQPPADLETVIESRTAPPASAPSADLAGILDEELSRLPEKYRSPLILHYLQGKTVEETARELGWRPGTVSGRLARGKELLRGRLVRRGVTLTIGTVAGSLGRDTGASALPPALLRAAIQAGMLVATRRTALIGGSAVSPRAAALARDTLRSLAFDRLRLVAGVVLGFVAVTLGAGVALLPSHRGDRPQLESSRTGPERGPDVVAGQDIIARLDADGDPLPQGAVLRLGSARLRHAGLLSSLSYTGDGSTLIAAGTGVIRTWDAHSGRALSSTIHRSLLFSPLVVVSPNGQMVAKYDMDPRRISPARIVLSPLASDVVIHGLEIPAGNARSLAFSKDGKYLAAGGDWHQIPLWSVATGRVVGRLQITGAYVTAVAFCPDGRLLAALDTNHMLRVWDLATGHERPLPLPAKGLVSSIAFSADGRVLACGQGGGDVSLWDLHEGKETRILHGRDNRGPTGRSESVQQLAITSDGKVVATVGNENTVRLWNLRRGEVQTVLQPGKHGHLLPSFSPDDQILAVGGGSEEIRLWDVDTCRPIPVTGEPGLGYCFAAVSPDGDIIATVGRTQQGSLWDAQTGRLVTRLDTLYFTRVAFSADGSRVSFCGGGSWNGLWDVTTQKQTARFVQQGSTAWVGLSPDQQFLAKPGRVWRAQSENALADPSWHENPPRARFAVFSPDSETIAWTEDGSPERDGGGRPTDPESRRCFVTFRQTQTGKEYCRIPCPDSCWAIAFSPDGRRVALAGLNYIQLWDLASQHLVHQLEEGPEDLFRFGYEASPGWRPIAFSHDGKILAAAGDGFSICLWDTATGRSLGKLSGHAGRILSLAFAPDDKLVSGSEDTTALIWKVARD
jgi:RNA polymerase sigma factor (sigma-70 family)